MSLTFCDGGGQPASQISQKAFISAFTFLRNGKAMWCVQFMVIRHKREEVKQAEGKRNGCEKVSGNFCSQAHYHFANWWGGGITQPSVKPDHSSIMALNGYFSLWDFKGYFIVQHVFWILEIKQPKDIFHSQILWWELAFQGSVDAWLLKLPLWRGQKRAVLHCSSVQPLTSTKFTRRCITPVRISDHKIM